MTEPYPPAVEATYPEFVRIWASTFTQVLAQIGGSEVPAAVQTEAPASLPAAGEADLWALISASGELRGEMSVRLPPATTLRLAQIFMSEPPAPEASLTADHREAVIELLRQVSGIVASSAKARWGEVQLRVQAAASPSWPAAATCWLVLTADASSVLGVEVALSAALMAELRAEKPEPVQAQSDRAPTAAPTESKPAPGALDLLMDVQLAVTMRFGARRLLLRDVLDLSPGAVVELDRQIQEPVDLLLDGKLIARGEVIVIDGNYGLRVTDATPLELQPGVD